jgi:hypothetical protein
MPEVISPTTFLRLSTSNLKRIVLYPFFTCLPLFLAGCMNTNTSLATSVVVAKKVSKVSNVSNVFSVSIDWERIVQAHPLQAQLRQMEAGLRQGKVVAGGAEYTLARLPLAPMGVFTLPPLQRTALKNAVMTDQPLAPKWVAEGGSNSSLVFRRQKQRLWEAEIQNSSLLALRQAELQIAAGSGATRESLEDTGGLLAYLQERRQVLDQTLLENPSLSESAIREQLIAQIVVVEQTQEQIPGIDLAIAVLERQRESLPNRGILLAEEVAGLTEQVKPDSVRSKDDLHRMMRQITTLSGMSGLSGKSPLNYSEQARLEVGATVYRSYRKLLEAQVQTVREAVQREQEGARQRQKEESAKQVEAQLKALQAKTPPGLNLSGLNLSTNIVSAVEQRTQEMASTGKSLLNLNNSEIDIYNQEKKRFNQIEKNKMIARMPIESAPVTQKNVVPVQSQLDPALNLSPIVSLRAFIEQDCQKRMQEVAREREMIIYIKKNNQDISYTDKTSDFLRWMWGYRGVVKGH